MNIIVETLSTTSMHTLVTLFFFLSEKQGHDIKVEPGDTIGIIPKNPSAKVQQLFERLDIEGDADRTCQISIIKTSTKKNASVPNYIPYQSSLRHIFESCLDLQSIPKKVCIILEYSPAVQGV